MTDDHTIRPQRRIRWGWFFIAACLLLLFAGGLNVLERLKTGQIPGPFPLVSLVLGAAALILGTILLIDGWTARWQTEKGSAREARRPVATRSHPALPEKGTAPAEPGSGPGRIHRASHGTIPGRAGLEEPTTKRCPGCAKDVYKEARVCRYCGYAFSVTLRLKVYPPQDDTKKDEVVTILAAKLRMPADDVTHLLEMGMRFKYDSPGKLAAARTRFESLGCRTEEYEKVGRE